MRRAGAVALLLAGAFAANASAQRTAARAWPPWRTSWFPYVTASPNDGAMAMLRIVRFQQAQNYSTLSLRRSASAEVGYSTRGSWLASARLDLPRAADGWRIAAFAGARGWEHYGDPDGDLRRESMQAWLDFTTRMRGPVHFSGRIGFGHDNVDGDWAVLTTRYPNTPLSACNFFPPCGPEGVSQTDPLARGAVVVDLRDREFDTRRGALLEGGVFVGGGGDGYHGAYALARGWATPRVGTRLTARAGARAHSRTSSVRAAHVIPAWEGDLEVLGGFHSHRGLADGELAGRGVLFAGVEGRHDVMNFGNIGAVTVNAFVDGGRVFVDPSPLVDPVPGAPLPSGDLRLTFDDWTVAAGGGVAVRVLRNAQLSLSVARANERTRLYVAAGTAW